MNVRVLFSLVIPVISTLLLCQNVSAQEPAIDLPVELIGFPVIILAVRLSNFAKKLAYSLNPRTYTSRTKRTVEGNNMIDMDEAEKRLIAELGEGVCIYTKVCLYHAQRTLRTQTNGKIAIDWNDVFSRYKGSTEPHKEYYLLSIFLGHIVGSPRLCNQLDKRGRACKD